MAAVWVGGWMDGTYPLPPSLQAHLVASPPAFDNLHSQKRNPWDWFGGKHANTKGLSLLIQHFSGLGNSNSLVMLGVQTQSKKNW